MYFIIICFIDEGVRQSGAAAVSPSQGVAIVTIAGGHQPHGFFQFSSSSLNAKTPPVANSTVQLTVIRKQGTIGMAESMQIIQHN